MNGRVERSEERRTRYLPRIESRLLEILPHNEVLRDEYLIGSYRGESKATVWIAGRMGPWMRYAA